MDRQVVEVSSLSLSFSLFLSLFLPLSLSFFLFLSLSLTIYLPTYLSIYLSIFLSIDLSIFLSFFLSYPIYLSYLSIYLSIYLPIYLSIHPSIYPSIYLSTFLSIYLWISQPIIFAVAFCFCLPNHTLNIRAVTLGVRIHQMKYLICWMLLQIDADKFQQVKKKINIKCVTLFRCVRLFLIRKVLFVCCFLLFYTWVFT